MTEIKSHPFFQCINWDDLVAKKVSACDALVCGRPVSCPHFRMGLSVSAAMCAFVSFCLLYVCVGCHCHVMYLGPC